MDLIIKPTMICNFKCDFCSSTEIADNNSQTLPHEKIFRFIERFPDTRTIIVNGGDPLMVPPEYYFKIIAFLEKGNYGAELSLTSNLWDWYKNPSKWNSLLKHPRVSVATSFQYGTGRKITKDRVLDEATFRDLISKFSKEFEYTPSFIAVIDQSNEDSVLKTVELAKELNTTCKVNFAMASGRQGKPYPKSKLYRAYLDIHKAGLEAFEVNTREILKGLSGKHTICPISLECDKHIRCLNPDQTYYSCGSFADDRLFSIDFEKEMTGDLQRPLDRPFITYLKEECFSCPMFKLCNGCKKHVFDLKNHGLVEEHCAEMKSIAKDLINASEYKSDIPVQL